MKHRLIGYMFLAISLLLAACQPQQPPMIPFMDLVANPTSYDGQLICTEGIYLSGFESSSLGAGTFERNGGIYLFEPVIWLEGAELEAQGECTQFQVYTFCPAIACGKFETGKGFGHLGSFSYQIIGAD